MDLADQIGAAVAEDLGAVLIAHKVALDIEIARLHLGAHRAVAEHDAIGEVVEEMRHRTWYTAGKPPSAALRGRGRVRWFIKGSCATRPPPLSPPSPPESGERGRFLKALITPRLRQVSSRARRAGGRSRRSDRLGSRCRSETREPRLRADAGIARLLARRR